MSQEDICTTVHPDALELAELLRPAWTTIDAGLRASGVPLCEGEAGEGEGEGGEGEGEGEGGGQGGADESKTFDAAYVKQLRAENAAARVARQEAEARVKEFEDRDKSEGDRLKDEKEAAEKRAVAAEQVVLRLKVGQKKGLPAEIAELLHGDDEEAMTKHADRLIKAGVTANGGGRPSFDGGVRRQSPPAGGMDAAIRGAAGRG